MEWTLKRNAWRPSLLKYAKDSDAAAVVAASSEAFAHLACGGGGGPTPDPSIKDVDKALTRLIKLKGVGPATASVILAVADASCPYLGEVALRVCQPDVECAPWLRLVLLAPGGLRVVPSGCWRGWCLRCRCRCRHPHVPTPTHAGQQAHQEPLPPPPTGPLPLPPAPACPQEGHQEALPAPGGAAARQGRCLEPGGSRR
jgi:hypothetical protein